MNFSECTTNEDKIDMVLRYVVNTPSRELLTRDQIASNMDAVVHEKEITEILLKLHKDGYIYTPNELGTGYFYSNFDGRILVQNGGYVEQKKINIEERRIIAKNESRKSKNDCRLILGTWFAGIAALLLLLWQVLLWYYPHYSDYPYCWIWQTIPKITKLKTF